MTQLSEQRRGASRFTAVPVVRQPIVDGHMDLHAYDLRFPSDPDVICVDGDPAQAWAWIHDSGTDATDLLALAGGAPAFLQITPQLLCQDAHAALRGSGAIVELTGVTESTAELVEACRQLPAAGLHLALDPLACGPGCEPLVELADVLCFDFHLARFAGPRFADGRFDGLGTTLLARKLITLENFQDAIQMGFGLFEGAFLSRPEITTGLRIPTSKINCLRFIEQVNQPQIDFDALEEVVKQDVALSVKLLKLINSPLCGLAHRVESIKQALVLLGEKPLRQWATLSMVAQIGEDKPSELMKIGLVRARFCELMGVHVGLPDRGMDLFMLGLLSVLDALLGCPLDEALNYLPPMLRDVKVALLGGDTPFGKLYGLIRAYDQDDQTRLEELTEALELVPAQVGEAYCHAIQWADRCAGVQAELAADASNH